MNKRSMFFVTLFSLSLFESAYAATTNSAVGGLVTIGTIADAFTQNVLQALGVMCMSAATVAFFYGMVQYINGRRQGNGDKTKVGNDFMIWGLVALFIMFSLWGIIYLVQGVFGIQGNNDMRKLFGGDIKLESVGATPNYSSGAVPNGSGNINFGNGVNFQMGGGGNGASGSGASSVIIGGSGGGAGVGFSVGSQGVQSTGFRVNGVPANQVPGVLSCRGRSVGSWCGSGMSCASANDGSISCFRDVDIDKVNGRAQKNAQASIPPSSSGAPAQTGGDCSSSYNLSPSDCSSGMACINYKCSYPPNYGADCASNTECKGGAVCDLPGVSTTKSPTYTCINPVAATSAASNGTTQTTAPSQDPGGDGYMGASASNP